MKPVSTELLLFIITYTGVAAAAVSGVMEARRKDMDIVGAVTVAFITSPGRRHPARPAVGTFACLLDCGRVVCHPGSNHRRYHFLFFPISAPVFTLHSYPGCAGAGYVQHSGGRIRPAGALFMVRGLSDGRYHRRVWWNIPRHHLQPDSLCLRSQRPALRYLFRRWGMDLYSIGPCRNFPIHRHPAGSTGSGRASSHRCAL